MNLGVLEHLNETFPSLVEKETTSDWYFLKIFQSQEFFIRNSQVITLNKVSIESNSLSQVVSIGNVEYTQSITGQDLEIGKNTLIFSDLSGYVGKIVLSETQSNMLQTTSTIRVFNKPIHPAFLVKIPDKQGVFSINGVTGDVIIQPDTLDESLFFNLVENEGNSIVFNAVGYHEGKKKGQLTPLLSLNDTPQLNNAVYVDASDQIRIHGKNSTLNIEKTI